jgi:nucleoside-triphosphatase
MKRVFLLTGAPGAGKTTAIRKIVSYLSCSVGGFYTEEIREGGVRTGFRLITLDGRQGTLAHVNIRGTPRISKYGVDLTTLDTIGTDSIRHAIEENDVVIIDEIGPMEILSPRFREAVVGILSSDVIALGTIVKRQTDFTDAVKEHSSVLVVEITRSNHDQVIAQILALIRNTGLCDVEKE